MPDKQKRDFSDRLFSLLCGETPEEYFERHPEAASFVDRQGRTYANPQHIAKAIRKFLDAADAEAAEGER